jgi:hypothetical protein
VNEISGIVAYAEPDATIRPALLSPAVQASRRTFRVPSGEELLSNAVSCPAMTQNHQSAPREFASMSLNSWSMILSSHARHRRT